MTIDINTGYKGSERHGANKTAFKPLRVVLFGDESNDVFCVSRDKLRDLGHDVITKSYSEFAITDLSKLVKDFDVIYPIPSPVKSHTPLPPEPEEDEEVGEEEQQVEKEKVGGNVDIEPQIEGENVLVDSNIQVENEVEPTEIKEEIKQ